MTPLLLSGPGATSLVPGVPTFSTAGLGEFTLDAWSMLIGPAGLPAEIRDTVARAMGTVLAAGERLVFRGGWTSVGAVVDSAAAPCRAR